MSFDIYLAGGKSDWRTTLRRRWGQKYGADVSTFDPFEDSRQGALYEFTNDDLAAISGSDMVFAFCDYHKYTGMALEFGYAHALEIPIIFVVGPGMPRIDSMMVSVATAAFTDMTEARDFVEERYLDKLEQ